jgi:hypothetical protein
MARCNSAVSQYVASLLSGGTNNPDAIVEYAKRFTPDTWGVLGRNEYGSDWWPALLKRRWRLCRRGRRIRTCGIGA